MVLFYYKTYYKANSNFYFENKIYANTNQVLTSTGFINNTGNAGPFYLIVKNSGSGGLQVV